MPQPPSLPTRTALDADVLTVSVGAVVIANNSVSEEAIYNLTKSLFDGAENNASAHAKYNELDMEEAASVTSVPYHPGAAKYFEEQGIDRREQVAKTRCSRSGSQPED